MYYFTSKDTDSCTYTRIYTQDALNCVLCFMLHAYMQMLVLAVAVPGYYC